VQRLRNFPDSIGLQTQKMQRLFTSLCLMLLTVPMAHAQDKHSRDGETQKNQYQLLLQRLQQRDQVIFELLERVETLENDLGVKPVRTKKDVLHNSNKQTINTAESDKAGNQPGLVVTDERVAERALERSLTLDGALLLPSGIFEIEPQLIYSRREDSTSSFVMSGSSVLASETERNSDSLSANIIFRLGLPGDLQLEIGLPYRWRRVETVTDVNFSPTQASSMSGNGLGDVRISLAKTLLRQESGQPNIIGRLAWDTDSGEISDDGVGLGGGFNEVQASLRFIKRQDPVVFVGGLSYTHTFVRDSVQPGVSYAANYGGYLALNPQTSLNLVLSMAYQDETKYAGTRLKGSDRTSATLYIGGSSLIARGTLLNLSLGIGLTRDADDFSVLLSIPIRFE